MAERSPAIVCHGGAGRLAGEGTGEQRLAGCCRAARAGYERLAADGSALEAVEAAVREMEDDFLFNAGYGAVLNDAGEVELDASIMDGASLRAGAVGAVRRIAHPVALARRILETSPHVLLVAEGAERFAAEAGIPRCAPRELIEPAQRRRWQDAHGTVGAVARDARGVLASATSTGGTFDKHPGRVGDSAVIGGGTYADTRAAVSCTGQGEAILQAVLARATRDRIAAGDTPTVAAAAAVEELVVATGGEAGVILIDRTSGIGHAHNTAHMPVCAIDGEGRLRTAS